MNKYEISKRIENFAPLDTQEEWDCSGWAVDSSDINDVHKIMLCLTVTEDVIKQTLSQNCDMIVSHHPMFSINIESELLNKNYEPKINIYCAHTNLDRADGGTTDTLIENLIKSGLDNISQIQKSDFLRIAELNDEISIEKFNKIIKVVSAQARFVNNSGVIKFKKIAFCAGSGSEFISQACELGADCLVTGDLKFHTALDSEITVYDIGHFESEILVLPVFEKIIGNEVEFVYANEHSPFIYPNC